MRLTLAALPSVLGALALAACGGASSDTKTVVKTVTAPASTTPAQTTESTPEATQPQDTTCEGLGINSTELHEGLCTDDDGTRFKVVNKAHTLTLPELNVRFLGYSTAKTLSSDIESKTASGVYAIFRLRVTNKTDGPVEFDPDQVGLTVTPGSRTKSYEHDFEAENMPGESFVWNSDKIPPESSRMGTVVFDIPRRRVPEIERSGNLTVLQFSDASSFSDRAEHAIGIIRTYR